MVIDWLIRECSSFRIAQPQILIQSRLLHGPNLAGCCWMIKASTSVVTMITKLMSHLCVISAMAFLSYAFLLTKSVKSFVYFCLSVLTYFLPCLFSEQKLSNIKVYFWWWLSPLFLFSRQKLLNLCYMGSEFLPVFLSVDRFPVYSQPVSGRLGVLILSLTLTRAGRLEKSGEFLISLVSLRWQQEKTSYD